ncbi:MAG TPA: hypothetical protein VG963_15870 [Polyangiaceae bacterium]|nr:hypothetical protein [Polyangiaceae bacterium]
MTKLRTLGCATAPWTARVSTLARRCGDDGGRHMALRTLVGAILLGVLCVDGGVARADSFVLGNSATGNTPTVYRRSNPGPCSKSALPFTSPTYVLSGTDSADVIYVHDTGGNMSWCGYSIPALTQLPANTLLSIHGGLGQDTIWAGQAFATDLITGSPESSSNDNAVNYIYAGSAVRVYGGDQGNFIFLPSPVNDQAIGGNKSDTFCTFVTNVFYNVNVRYINGGGANDPYDVRTGPAAATEFRIEFTGNQSNACDWTLAAMVNSVLAM